MRKVIVIFKNGITSVMPKREWESEKQLINIKIVKEVYNA